MSEGRVPKEGELIIQDFLPELKGSHLADSIVEGLLKEPKEIPSMFFYDERGSKLYEMITELPEYYPPKLEKRLIAMAADAMAHGLRGHDIVELGSGDCSKISILLGRVPAEDIPTLRYVPVDFSRSAVEESAAELRRRFPGMDIHGIVGDFLSHLDCVPDGRRRLLVFFGSTIGNLEREKAYDFFQELAQVLRPGDEMLLGVDMVKDAAVMEEAYNDSQGVTAEFNRNIVNVVNRMIGSQLDPGMFEHVAFFNPEESRIEMHLRALAPATVRVEGLEAPIEIQEGEMIHTENSYKFTPEQVQGMIEGVGLSVRESHSDERGWFSLLRLGA